MIWGYHYFWKYPYEHTTTQGSYVFRNTSPICLLTTALKSLNSKTQRPSENWVLLTLLTQNDSQRWLGEKVVVEKEKAHGDPAFWKITGETGEIFTVVPWNEWFAGLWFRRELKKLRVSDNHSILGQLIEAIPRLRVPHLSSQGFSIK